MYIILFIYCMQLGGFFYLDIKSILSKMRSVTTTTIINRIDFQLKKELHGLTTIAAHNIDERKIMRLLNRNIRNVDNLNAVT